eukprot:COSAG01_NODE_17205_length_1170_cov_1.547152_2_plen_135_part_00
MAVPADVLGAQSERVGRGAEVAVVTRQVRVSRRTQHACITAAIVQFLCARMSTYSSCMHACLYKSQCSYACARAQAILLDPSLHVAQGKPSDASNKDDEEVRPALPTDSPSHGCKFSSHLACLGEHIQNQPKSI